MRENHSLILKIMVLICPDDQAALMLSKSLTLCKHATSKDWSEHVSSVGNTWKHFFTDFL